jgi:predicted alpha/beta hydrolase family esterase
LFCDKTCFVGHSIGATFIADYLAVNQMSFQKAIFVSGLYKALGNEDFDGINSSFFEHKATVTNFFRESKSITYAFYGDNDPYVPHDTLKEFAQMVKANTTVIPQGGHLNKAAGYETFDALLKVIS